MSLIGRIMGLGDIGGGLFRRAGLLPAPPLPQFERPPYSVDPDRSTPGFGPDLGMIDPHEQEMQKGLRESFEDYERYPGPRGPVFTAPQVPFSQGDRGSRIEEPRIYSDPNQFPNVQGNTVSATRRPTAMPVGAKEQFLSHVIGAQSGGNPRAKNPLSSAAGLGQYITSTWEGMRRRHPELGLTPDGRFDAAQSRRALQASASDYEANIRSAGLPETPGTYYLNHFLGEAGARNLFRHPDDAPIASVMPEIISANPFLRGKSVGQVKAWAEKKMGGPSGASKGGKGTGMVGNVPQTPTADPSGRGVFNFGVEEIGRGEQIRREVAPVQSPEVMVAQEIAQSGDTTPLRTMTLEQRLAVLREFLKLGGFKDDILGV